MYGLIVPWGGTFNAAAMIARTWSGSMMVGVDVAASPAENADRRDFVVWVLGVSEKAEITSSVVPMASHVLRACRVAPVVDALHSGVPVTEAFGESGVLAQQSFLFRELPPQAAIQRDVSGNVRVQHDGSPGHGCAIFMSIGRSTLA